ncbi:MAG: ECF transporter S component [Candidatus Korarchaeota archaeon]|nr:ECF transporter S component [Candidatus Korarchaeota archaeon]
MASERSFAKLVATIGVMAALTTVATIIIQIPTPATQGYINLGDTMVMLSGTLFGTLVGSLAGGIGSALADLITGYGHWAPFTLVIKGIEGYIAGLAKGRGKLSTLIILIIAGAEMVTGYFLVEMWMYGLGGALAEVLGNSFQAASGIVFAYILTPVVRRALGNET